MGLLCLLFTGYEVRLEQYFVELEVAKTVQGRRPRAFETETKHFSIRIDLNGKKVFILNFAPMPNQFHTKFQRCKLDLTHSVVFVNTYMIS